MDRAPGGAAEGGDWVACIGRALALAACALLFDPAWAAENNRKASDPPTGTTLPQAASSTSTSAKAATPAPASSAAPAAAIPATTTAPGSAAATGAPLSRSVLDNIDWEYTSFGVYGPTFKSADGQNKLTVGFFTWFDNTAVTNDNLAKPLGESKLEGDSRISTARLEFHGTYTEDFYYYFRVDFQNNGTANGHAAVEWAAVGIQNLPIVRNLLIGLQQPIYALDIWANYPRHRLMLEPSLINAFYRGPLLGITAYNVDMVNRFSWGLGVARDTSDDHAAGLQAVSHGQDAFLVHGRIAWFPRYLEQGRHLLHFGVSGAYFKPKDHSITWGIWPETYTDDTSRWPVAALDHVDWSMIGVAEFRAAEGPAWIQSDYLRNWNHRTGARDLDFDGWYVEGGYFLTGEQTVFSPLALNGPVMPMPVFKPREGKFGAWELQLRYSRLDLVDGNFHGGGPPFTQGASVHNITLGLNWFLNAHAKMGVDFVHSTRSDLGNARYDVIEARLAWSL